MTKTTTKNWMKTMTERFPYSSYAWPGFGLDIFTTKLSLFEGVMFGVSQTAARGPGDKGLSLGIRCCSNRAVNQIEPHDQGAGLQFPYHCPFNVKGRMEVKFFLQRPSSCTSPLSTSPSAGQLEEGLPHQTVASNVARGRSVTGRSAYHDLIRPRDAFALWQAAL